MQGTARWSVPGGKWQPLRLLTRLPVGARVEVSARSTAVLSSVRGGARTALGPGAKVVVESNGVKGTGAASTSPRPGVVAVLPSEVNLDRMAGKVRGDVELTNDPAFMGAPVVSWWVPSSARIAELEVVVTRPKPSGAEDRVFKQVVTGTSVTLPALTPGVYQVRVEASRSTGARGDTAEMALTVLDPAACAEIQALQASDDVVSQATLLARAWDLGLYSVADEAARRLTVLRAQDPVAWRQRARVAAWRKKAEDATRLEAEAAKRGG